jgi:DNA polymerase-3 subunit alpha
MIPEIKNEFIYGKKSIFDEDHNVIGMSDEPSDYCEGAVNRGYDLQLCEKIFDNMAAFAKYSFNKSH